MMSMMSLQNVPVDVQNIIVSFLGPFELVQYRQLTKDSMKIITAFLQRTKHTTKLESLVCPICIKEWLSTEEIELIFIDIDINLHYEEVFNRLLFVEECGGTILDQRHLFCDACETKCSTLNYLPNFKNNKYYNLYFSYNNAYPWSCVIMEKAGKLYWNQYSFIDNQICEDIDKEDHREMLESYYYRFRYED